MRQPEAPCYGCTPDTGRSPTCHSTCEKYIEFVRLSEEWRAEKRKIVEEYQAQYDIEHRRIKMASEGKMYRRKRNG